MLTDYFVTRIYKCVKRLIFVYISPGKFVDLEHFFYSFLSCSGGGSWLWSGGFVMVAEVVLLVVEIEMTWLACDGDNR